MCVMSSQITCSSIIHLAICSGEEQRTIKGSHYGPFSGGIHWWLVDSLHKGSVMWEEFHIRTSSWKSWCWYLHLCAIVTQSITKHDISWCKPTTNWKTRCDFELRIATPGLACVTVWGQWHCYKNIFRELLVSVQQGQHKTLIELNFKITKGTPYLDLMGKVCGFHC